MLQQTFYNICFRREENMCEIDYSVTTAGSFQLGVGVATNKGQAITVSRFGRFWPNSMGLFKVDFDLCENSKFFIFLLFWNSKSSLKLSSQNVIPKFEFLDKKMMVWNSAVPTIDFVFF